VLVVFSTSVIPILPLILLAGYTLQITRQAVHGQELHLPEWEEFGRLLLDGLRASAINLVYLAPGLVVMLGGAAIYLFSAISLPFSATIAGPNSAQRMTMPFFFLIGMGVMFLVHRKLSV